MPLKFLFGGAVALDVAILSRASLKIKALAQKLDSGELAWVDAHLHLCRVNGFG